MLVGCVWLIIAVICLFCAFGWIRGFAFVCGLVCWFRVVVWLGFYWVFGCLTLDADCLAVILLVRLFLLFYILLLYCLTCVCFGVGFCLFWGFG